MIKERNEARGNKNFDLADKIRNELKEKGIEIERNSIELEAPIKSLGIYDVNVNIAKGLSEKIKVYVIQA